MKILVDVSQIVYSGMGVGRYVAGLSKSLLLSGSPHEFTFYAGVLKRKDHITSLARREPYVKATWKILPIPPKLARLVFNHTTLSMENVVGSYDLFHSSDWTQPTTKMPSVTTVHDLVFKLFPETVDPLVLSTQRARLKKVVSGGTHIIADSKSTKNDLMKEYKLSSERITVIYPGIDASLSPAKKKEIEHVKRKHHITSPYVLCLGTKEPRKNLQKAVEGFEIFRQKKENQNYQLVISGRHGWGKDVTSNLDFVNNLEYVEEDDLPGLYSGAEVFLYPSFYEGFGFPVLEAMACGTPVVTSNVSSLPEIAGDAAVLIDPQSAKDIAKGLELAINDRQTLTHKGLLQAKKFTWKKAANETIKVYEKIGAYDKN